MTLSERSESKGDHSSSQKQAYFTKRIKKQFTLLIIDKRKTFLLKSHMAPTEVKHYLSPEHDPAEIVVNQGQTELIHFGDTPIEVSCKGNDSVATIKIPDSRRIRVIKQTTDNNGSSNSTEVNETDEIHLGSFSPLRTMIMVLPQNVNDRSALIITHQDSRVLMTFQRHEQK